MDKPRLTERTSALFRASLVGAVVWKLFGSARRRRGGSGDDEFVDDGLLNDVHAVDADGRTVEAPRSDRIAELAARRHVGR